MSFRFERRGLSAIVRTAAALSLVAPVVPHAVAQAQSIVVAGPQRASRTELTARVADLEQQIARGGKADALRKLRQEVDAIRNRLISGDFRVGDRFVLTVRQDSVRSDTVAVRDSLKVSLLNLPDVSLAGVLRAELDERMNTHLSTYLRNVEARANILTRISILGAVARPGFYYAAPDRPITDVVMLAGGPAPNANLAELEVSRGATKLLRAKDSKRMLKEGRTLEQLDVQSGDDIRIPEKRKINWQLVIQLFFILSSLTFAFVNFLRWYYDRQE
jgi:protein involved in polysaccharide export with SLBB domain